MDMKLDYVIYNHQIFRIHEIAKKLGLSMSTYRKYRLQGLESQSAFDKCLTNLPDMVIYQGEVYAARKLIKELGLGLRTYERKMKSGSSAQEAFDYVLNQKINKEKITQSGLSSEAIQKRVRKGVSLDDAIEMTQQKKDALESKRRSYFSRGLPEEYTSLHEYCFCNNLDYRRIWELLETKPDISLEEAVDLYSSVSGNYRGNLKHVVYGVSFKAFCLKYNYPYSTCLNYFHLTGDIFLAFMYYEIVRLNFSISDRKKIQQIVPFLLEVTDDILEDTMQMFDIPVSFIEKIKQLQLTAMHLRSELFYYEVHYFVESQWEVYCFDELQTLDISDLHQYHHARLAIYKKFKRDVFQLLGFEQHKIEEMYRRYEDLLFYTTQDQTVWRYKKELKR